jgi:tetratricopeptide (TPR) repeat protein
MITGVRCLKVADDLFKKALLLIKVAEIEEGVCLLQEAIDIYYFFHDSKKRFDCHLCLANAYGRLGFLSMAKHHANCSELLAQEPIDYCKIKRVSACISAYMGNLDEAKSLTTQALLLARDISDADNLRSCLIVSSDIQIMSKNYLASRVLLHELLQFKISRKEKTILDLHYISFLMREKRISGKFGNLLVNAPEFYKKWLITYHLQSGRLQEARHEWAWLVRKYPLNFDHGFIFKSPLEKESLFAHVITDVKQRSLSSPNLDHDKKESLSSRLISILNNYNFPLSKEDLIENIWQTTYGPDMDARFYKLVERTKKILLRRNLSIQKNDLAYSLISNEVNGSCY